MQTKGRESKTLPDIKIIVPPHDQSPPDLVGYNAATSIYGEWFNINPDNSAKLIFNLDGTFQYIVENGLANSVKGKWTINNSDYILRSPQIWNKNESSNSKDHFPSF
jgi:hypothetical protein